LIIEEHKQSTIETMTMSKLASTIWAVLLILLFLVQSEAAGSEESAATQTRIRITADRLESDHEMKLVQFTGNVVATEDDVVIEADRMKIFYTPGEDESVEAGRIDKIVSEGNVKIVFDNATKTAVADKAVYMADKKVLELSGGDPKVWSGKNVIRGKKITVFQTENRSLVEGDDGNQVEATLFVEEGDGLKK
jgi:lipopolysaccharide transport protein LptA